MRTQPFGRIPSRLIRRSGAALALCLVAIPAAYALAGDRYVVVINRAHDSVVGLSTAVAGQDAYRDAALGEPLRGGGATATIELQGEGCLRDFRVAFRDGRQQLYRDVDVCRRQRLQLRPFPRDAASRRHDGAASARD